MKLNLSWIFAITVFLSVSFSTYAQTPGATKHSTKPFTTQKATTEDGREVVLKSNGTWQYAQKPTVDLKVNFQGKYVHKSGVATAHNVYPNNQELTITETTTDTYDWTFQDIGYMHSVSLYGTCKATNNFAECYVIGSNNENSIEDQDLKTNIPVFTLKMIGNSILTKWEQYETAKGFTRYFKKVLSFR